MLLVSIWKVTHNKNRQHLQLHRFVCVCIAHNSHLLVKKEKKQLQQQLIYKII